MCVTMNCSPRPLRKNLAFANNLRLDSELKGACVHSVLCKLSAELTYETAE